MLDRPNADDEHLRDLAIAAAAGDEGKDVDLAGSEPIGVAATVICRPGCTAKCCNPLAELRHTEPASDLLGLPEQLLRLLLIAMQPQADQKAGKVGLGAGDERGES